MANTKISALPSGDPAQSGDTLPIDRAGSNFAVTAGSIAALGAIILTATVEIDVTANDVVSFDTSDGTLAGLLCFPAGANPGAMPAGVALDSGGVGDPVRVQLTGIADVHTDGGASVGQPLVITTGAINGQAVLLTLPSMITSGNAPFIIGTALTSPTGARNLMKVALSFLAWPVSS